MQWEWAKKVARRFNINRPHKLGYSSPHSTRKARSCPPRQGQSGRIRIDYCADQVAPPFSVVKLRPSSSVTVALLGLDARTAVIVPSAGGVAPNQPFFVRRRTNPFSPTSHATSALTSAPARTARSAVCSATQVAPPSVECSITRSRIRQRVRRAARRPRRITPTSAGAGIGSSTGATATDSTAGASRRGLSAARADPGVTAGLGCDVVLSTAVTEGAGVAGCSTTAAALTGVVGASAVSRGDAVLDPGSISHAPNATIAIPATAAPIVRGDTRGERCSASRSRRRAASKAAHSAQPATCRSTAITSRENNVPSRYPTSRAGSGHMR